MKFPENPCKLFNEWFDAAKASDEEKDATAMSLATATSEGVPSVRTVLLKSFDESGAVFYTNVSSRKSQELLENPYAAICFYWPSLDKQVRMEGKVESVTDREADVYFATRSRNSQLGAWASRQSQVMKNPEELMQCYSQMERKFANKEVPRPPFWSGFRLKPEYMEFWQSGEHRLHLRVCYTRIRDQWEMQYLFP